MAPEIDWQSFVKAAAQDDGQAANDHLAAGRAIYYRERTTPRGLLIKERPDGIRQLVRFNPAGDDVVASLA